MEGLKVSLFDIQLYFTFLVVHIFSFVFSNDFKYLFKA